MPVERTMISIHDDEFGAGESLAFPSMSTCAACVVVLPNRLVGIHKTSRWNNKKAHIFQLARSAIGTAVKQRLYIAGWHVGNPAEHDVAQIRNALGCANVPTYIFNFANTIMAQEVKTQDGGHYFVESPMFKSGLFGTKANDLCTFAFHDRTKARIGVKRTEKVKVQKTNRTVQKTHLQNRYGGDYQYMACIDTITTDSDHLHWLNLRRV